MTDQESAPTWRLTLGVVLLVVGFASPLLIPLVTSSTLSPAWKAALTGLLAVGIPEILMVVAVGIMGKSGYEALKASVSRFFRTYGPAQRVSSARYRIGLIMFAAPLLLAWLGPYLGYHIPGYEKHPKAFALAGDVIFVTSLFVLGGEFWDKVRSLFHHGARAVFPEGPGLD